MAFDVVESAGLNPATDTDTTLYTSTGATIALVSVVNMSTSTNSLVAIAHRRSGAALDDTMYKMRNFELRPGEDRHIGPFMVANTGIITCRANSTECSFTMEGFSTS